MKSSLDRETVHVLGPLEIAPRHFAVGEKSYAAIKGDWPRVNEMRQAMYEAGDKEIADILGDHNSRAEFAEQALRTAESNIEALKKRIGELTNLIATKARDAERAFNKMAKEKDGIIRELKKTISTLRGESGADSDEVSDDRVDSESDKIEDSALVIKRRRGGGSSARSGNRTQAKGYHR